MSPHDLFPKFALALALAFFFGLTFEDIMAARKRVARVGFEHFRC